MKPSKTKPNRRKTLAAISYLLECSIKVFSRFGNAVLHEELSPFGSVRFGSVRFGPAEPDPSETNRSEES